MEGDLVDILGKIKFKLHELERMPRLDMTITK